jgi:hypothetical protein
MTLYDGPWCEWRNGGHFQQGTDATADGILQCWGHVSWS